ncbi:hypothetical protein CVIRNUC_004076 [Coccomyxa viridis]|uniref:Uncharacterized protein n=1 Tax=Coccomyxa viridis TaxID=1274662 RepID=A0AAV1I0H2_9CHLO|nr:hypothetical protein CVIRNUC_004076 [Coccomyxa viridis]
MAACTTAEQPLTAPQAAGHHTAVDSILLCSVAAGSPDALCSLPGDVQEPPIIHWTAMHPVPLPQ